MLAKAWIGDADGARELAHDSLARIGGMPADHPDTLRLSAYVALTFSWAGDTAGRQLSQDLLRRSQDRPRPESFDDAAGGDRPVDRAALGR